MRRQRLHLFHFSPTLFMHRRSPAAQKGFTLIELLLVIGIIAILASIVIVAINPNKQLGDARNAQRRADVNTILNAVYQYAIDHNGALPGTPAIDTVTRGICKSDAASCGGAGLSLRILTGAYVVKLPFDPQTTSATGTNYTIVKDASNRITVAAPGAENATITVSR